MRNLFMSFLALFFPWVVMLSYDNPGAALVALIMQATLIGWLPATIWAFRVIGENENRPRQRNDE